MEERIYEPKFYSDEDLKNKSGIYQIRNLVNNKIYVGSTKNFYERKKFGHFNNLWKNKHDNIKLQNTYDKYGSENLIFEVIEFIEDVDELLNIEQYWIDRLDVIKNGYNINPLADKPPSQKGKKFSDRHKLNLSKNSGNAKKIICLETKQIFNSAIEAGKYIGKDSSHITGCCRNVYNTAYNLHWMYYSDYLNCPKKDIKNKLSLKGKRCTPVICLDTREIFISITDASIKKNINSNSIIQCCKGFYKTAGKLKWKYIDKI